jgi:hypothetical protein
MWLRIGIALLAVVVGSLLAASNDVIRSGIGIEIIGIAITVAIVDALFEFRRKQVEARSLARRILSQLDYMMWVWQGGRRDSSIYELNALLRMIKAHHDLTDSTAELIFLLGCEAQSALELQDDIVKVSKDLRRGLKALKPLVAMRDPGGRLSALAIQTQCMSAAAKLARVARVDITWASSEPQIRLHDPSLEAQMRRVGHPVRAQEAEQFATIPVTTGG